MRMRSYRVNETNGSRIASKISNEFHARTSRASANIDRSRVCMRFGKSLAPTAAFLCGSFSVRRSPWCEKQSVKTVCVWHDGWAREKTHLGANKLWPLLTRAGEVFAASVLTSAHPHFSALRAATAWEMRARRTAVKCKVTLGVIAHGN